MNVPTLPGIVARIVRPWLSTNLRAHTILTGPLKGARIVASWHDYPAGISGATELPLLNWFQEHVRPGTTWLDIGAHYGYTAIALSRLVGAAGRVFAFEPVIATAGCLAQARQLNKLSQLTVVPLGLGSPESLSRVALPLTRGMADRTLDDADGPWLESVQVARLDWLWPMINTDRDTVNGVKIDVQGMELDVLAGMEHLLRRHRPKLVVEFHRGVDREPILDLLDGAGYCRQPQAIEPQAGTSPVELLDDRSYFFEKAIR